MNKKSLFTGITKNIFILGMVSFLTDLSSQMVFPLIPLFLTTIGATASIVGLVEGAAESTASLLKILSGYWSDKLKKRKLFVLIGYSFSSFTKPLFALTTVWPLVLLIRVVERFGKGFREAPRDALIAESTEQNSRGKSYGFHRAMDGLGSALGAIMAFLLLSRFHYNTIFLLAFIPGIFAIASIFWVKESKEKPVEIKSKKLKVSLKQLPGNLKFFIFVTMIFSFAHFGYPFLLLRAKQIGYSDSSSVFLYSMFYIIYTLISIPAGSLSDKLGRKIIVGTGYIFFALISLVLILTTTKIGIVTAFILYGIFFALIDGTQRAFIVDLAPENLKGTALGTFHTAIGISALPSGYIAGLLWDKINPGATFIFGAVLSIIAFVLLLFVKKIKPIPVK